VIVTTPILASGTQTAIPKWVQFCYILLSKGPVYMVQHVSFSSTPITPRNSTETIGSFCYKSQGLILIYLSPANGILTVKGSRLACQCRAQNLIRTLSLHRMYRCLWVKEARVCMQEHHRILLLLPSLNEDQTAAKTRRMKKTQWKGAGRQQTCKRNHAVQSMKASSRLGTCGRRVSGER
jgi:hypothetical protein